MAVKINVATKTPGGIDLPAGVIVVFRTDFPAVKLQMKQTYAFYKDLTTVQEGGIDIPEIQGIGKKMSWEYELNDFALLDQAKIEQTALDYIEAVVGVGNCETVTKDQLQPVVE